MEEFQPQELLIITDLETLRVMADPLRSQIYEILLKKPATVGQVAEQLGLAPSRLYYHVNMLERHGLIRVVATNMVANMVEKFYRATAKQVEIAPDLLNFSKPENQEALTGMLTSALDATREDMLRSITTRQHMLSQGAEARERRVTVARRVARVPDEFADEFHKRLEALLDEFEAQDAPDADLHYGLLVAFYPIFYNEDNPSEGTNDQKKE
ncbi:MAG: helix-turn-helix domain-containing protein [Chloroflexi bacterium]|nr:helix-turn-helix domain-containing protein [Chloroflexota bacterium]